MDLDQLRLLETVARLGTLSAAADELHVTQPALSRSLARLEKDLGHRLFDRPGRRLVLNDAGAVALEHARAILREERAMRLAVDDVARRARALRVGTVAPAPLWRLTALTVERFPGRLLTSETREEPDAHAGLLDGTLDLAITLRPTALPTVRSTRLMVENLAVCLPLDHPLAGMPAVRAAELDGETFLLLEDIGFWRGLSEELFPSSEFVVQRDRAVFEQLAATSSLAYFVTDAPMLTVSTTGRTVVPILDTAAHATFYLLCRQAAAPQAAEVFDWVRSCGNRTEQPGASGEDSTVG